jgi:hypothetical protein
MPFKGPDPRDTINIIDQLVEHGLLDEPMFRRMHHFGGSLSTFRKYCSTINSFRLDGANWRLHEELLKLLGSSSQRDKSGW